MNAYDRFLPVDLPRERVAACLGLVSDTHMPARCGELPSSLFDVLRGVDLLLHAGDVGKLWVLDKLSSIAPVVAVHGNDETAEAQRELPYQQAIAVAGSRVVLCHTHFPDPEEEMAWRRRKPRVRGDSLARRAEFGHRAGARIVVYGHTHVPMSYRYDGVLLVNPGAIAPPAPVYRQRTRTVALLYVRYDGKPFVVHVDLADPEQPFDPAWWREHDWPEGAGAISQRFTESIVDPEFVADSAWIWEHLQSQPARFREAYSAALLREAHRCWSGEIECITRSGVLSRLEADGSVPAETRDQLMAWIRNGKDSAPATQ